MVITLESRSRGKDINEYLRRVNGFMRFFRFFVANVLLTVHIYQAVLWLVRFRSYNFLSSIQTLNYFFTISSYLFYPYFFPKNPNIRHIKTTALLFSEYIPER